MTELSRRQRAFTLVELLTVLAVIALLVAILMPAFRMAREQGRIAACMSNMRQLSVGATPFLQENRDMPWTLPARMIAPGASDNTYTFNSPTPFIWGGAIPDKSSDEFLAANPIYARELTAGAYDVYRVPPRLRPLNRYLSSDVTWDAEPNPDLGLSREIPSETPGLFRCPSDSFSKVPTLGRFTPLTDDRVLPTWQYWGSSYAINWQWSTYYFFAPPGNGPPYLGGSQSRQLRILGFYEPSVAGLGAALLRNRVSRWESEFVLFMENSLNYALQISRPPGYSGAPWFPGEPAAVTGWHEQENRHVATFLDGSVRYQTMNNRHLLGDRWTTWPARPWQGATWGPLNDLAP